MEKNMKVNNIKKNIIFFLLIITYVSPSYSIENKSIIDNFKLFIEKEFLSYNIRTKTNVNSNYFSIFDLKKTEYLVSFKLLKKNINQDWILIPTLKVTRKLDEVRFSLTRSLAFDINSNLFEIETIAKMLVNSSLNQIKKNGLKFKSSDQQYKDKSEKKLKIRINYFNSCESNKIIEIMEKEFPGFIHLETDNFVTSATNSILYFTTSTKFKIKKWIELSLSEFNFSPNDFFIKIYNNKIDITKTNKFKLMYACE